MSNMMKAEKWLTVPEAANYMRLSKSSLYKKVMARSIPFYKFDGKLLFKPDELDRHIEGHRVVIDQESPGIVVEG